MTDVNTEFGKMIKDAANLAAEQISAELKQRLAELNAEVAALQPKIAIYDPTGQNGIRTAELLEMFGYTGFLNTEDGYIFICNHATNEDLQLHPGETIARIVGKIIVGKAITAPAQPDITVSEGGQD